MMIDWDKIKIRIDNDYVYLSGVNFESKIAEIHYYSGKPQTMAAYFSILEIDVATIDEGKATLIESLKNFILNLGVKTVNEIPVENVNFDIKWIGESGMLAGYVNRHKIFTIYQKAPENYFYKAFGYIESTYVLNLYGYEREIENSINRFVEKILP